MIDGIYDLLLTTPMGEKQGVARLTSSGTNLIAEVKVGRLPKQKGKGTIDGTSFSASGAITVPFLGSHEYTIEGKVTDVLLEATCQTSKGQIAITGIKRQD